jgi:hypothetical protein
VEGHGRQNGIDAPFLQGTHLETAVSCEIQDQGGYIRLRTENKLSPPCGPAINMGSVAHHDNGGERTHILNGWSSMNNDGYESNEKWEQSLHDEVVNWVDASS